MNPLLMKDFYKADHRSQYPAGTTLVYSNFTARSSRDKDIDYIVFFGLQYFIKDHLIDRFNREFFLRNKEDVIFEYKRIIDNCLGKDIISVIHIESLHDLGYLPIKIKALPEGTKCPIGVPCLTIVNTKPEFFWLTNMLETVMSTYLWGMCNTATIAHQYRKVLDKYAIETVGNNKFVDWQSHDFSYRGMFGSEAAMMGGAGHLLSFTGTDTIPAICLLEEFYNGNVEKEVIGGSVMATEHSCMMMGGKEEEFNTYKRLITEVYPSGIVSIVSDTWNLWNVLTDILPRLKKEIMTRNGKVVIRPDSSPKTPVEIICGDHEGKTEEERKGVVELLWDKFGGTISECGYRELDSHVGAIYGDSITLERAKLICENLKIKGFASTNIVFGTGSYTYHFSHSRDTFGFAVKATYGEVNGDEKDIFKDPITDNGTKKSLCGRIKVWNDNGTIKVKDKCSAKEEREGLLETVFIDGELVRNQKLSGIRQLLKNSA